MELEDRQKGTRSEGSRKGEGLGQKRLSLFTLLRIQEGTSLLPKR